jgi:NAD(P)-dependent dehydrogenase (short-subunit alcohol dehydrogenase family)
MSQKMKSVLVTGCSSGFGLLTAVRLAKDGWQVVATMRNIDRRGRLDKAAAEAGVTLDVVALDVCSGPSIDAAMAEALTITNGTMGAVVHNAGIGDGGYFEDTTDQTVRRIMETNFFGVLALTRAVLPVMRSQQGGRIVAVSSLSAFLGTPASSAYGASKRALEGWAESLACEVASFGIDISLVEPGIYRTDISENAKFARNADGPYLASMDVVESRLNALNDRFGRDPWEVADLVANLLTVRRPRFRNPSGPDAWLGRYLSHLLPFRTRVRLLNRLAGVGKMRP